MNVTITDLKMELKSFLFLYSIKSRSVKQLLQTLCGRANSAPKRLHGRSFAGRGFAVEDSPQRTRSSQRVLIYVYLHLLFICAGHSGLCNIKRCGLLESTFDRFFLEAILKWKSYIKSALTQPLPRGEEFALNTSPGRSKGRKVCMKCLVWPSQGQRSSLPPLADKSFLNKLPISIN